MAERARIVTRPLILDLFCKAGGAGTGYYRSGFDVVGVDIEPQKHYPFDFIQADALDYAASNGWRFDAVHASPPCQTHSTMTPKEARANHIDLIPHTRWMLESLGLPYVIENVEGARRVMRNPIMLCGRDFGLKVYRHRLFESNVMLFMPCTHEPHRDTAAAGADTKRRSGTRGISEKGFVGVAGHFSGVEYCKTAMGIDWMNGAELAQAIPPAYTEYIGRQLLQHVTNRATP